MLDVVACRRLVQIEMPVANVVLQIMDRVAWGQERVLNRLTVRGGNSHTDFGTFGMHCFDCGLQCAQIQLAELTFAQHETVVAFSLRALSGAGFSQRRVLVAVVSGPGAAGTEHS